jgi:plasmid maintenance system antidote protein VapI
MQRVRFDGRLVAEDMAAKGWQANDLARKVRPQVATSTITRFINGDSQTAPIAKRIAKALGHSVRRYIVSAESAVAS